jgi:O-antigen/teichoic acid export membrane protein
MISNLINRCSPSGWGSNRRALAENISWALGGKLVNVFTSVAVGILVARHLGPDAFGMMSYVISYVTLFSVLSAFGLDNIEVRELSRKGHDRERVMGSAFAIRACLSIGTVLLIVATLIAFESDPFIFNMVLVYSLSLLFGTLNVIRNYFVATLQNRYVVKTEIVRTLMGAGIKASLLIAHSPVSWFIAATAFDAALIGGGYIYSYRRKEGSLTAWRFEHRVAATLVRESFPLLLSGSAMIIYLRINEVMVRHLMDSASVGLFAAASRLTELAIILPLMLCQTVTPLLVTTRQDDPARYVERRQEVLAIVVWAGVTVSALLCLLAEPIILWLYGEAFVGAIPVLRIMAWKAVFSALFGASGQLIIVEGLQRLAVFRNLIGCMVSVALNALFIPRWGLVGSAWSAVITLAMAGYMAHLFIGPYRHLWPMQTKALLLGWRIGLRALTNRV